MSLTGVWWLDVALVMAAYWAVMFAVAVETGRVLARGRR